MVMVIQFKNNITVSEDHLITVANSIISHILQELPEDAQVADVVKHILNEAIEQIDGRRLLL